MHEVEQRELLLQAIIHEDAVEVHWLLGRGASLKHGAYHDYMNAPPLWHAAAQGNLEIVTILVEYGADLEGRSEWDCTPLTYAATHSHLDIIRYLLEEGADINAEQCCGTILICIIREASLETIQLLVESGADIHFIDKTGRNALDWAMERGRFEIVELLRQSGCRRENRTMHAPEQNLAPRTEIIRFLTIFQRTLSAIIEYTNSDDKEGILLGGHLADALHNVPQMLLRGKESGGYTVEEITNWMLNVPVMIQRYRASERIIEEAKRIVSLDYIGSELELNNDLSNIDLAPISELQIYLSFLYHGCLDLRLMRSYGRSPVNRSYHPFEDLEQVWTEEADKSAAYCQKLATILLPIPKGLVHWKRFDTEHFRQNGAALLGNDWEIYWSKFFSLHK